MQDTYIGDEGKGFPLVLVHGFLGSSIMWKPQIDFFKEIYKSHKKKIKSINNNILIYQIIRDSINLMVKDLITNTIKNIKKGDPYQWQVEQSVNKIIENLNQKVPENLLFSLLNVALQDNKYLLFTSSKPVSSFKFKLPDLNSRISSCISIGIKLPSDDLISVILSKNFSDKQIKVEKKHIDYIIKRIDRSYEKISQFILTLDKYSLKKGSPFNLKLIKEVLKMI